ASYDKMMFVRMMGNEGGNPSWSGFAYHSGEHHFVVIRRCVHSKEVVQPSFPIILTNIIFVIIRCENGETPPRAENKNKSSDNYGSWNRPRALGLPLRC